MTKKVVAIIQARVGSTRLPGKSTMLLSGEPLVGRVLERVKASIRIDDLVLAIPNTKENEILEFIGQKHGVKVFKGSELDLVDRYYNAAYESKSDYVVRIPADNPLVQASEIDKIIEHHLTLNRRGFSSNLAQINGSGYPDGIGAEIFDFSLLEEIYKDFSNLSKREHIHLNFFNYETQISVNENWCPVSTCKCPAEFARPDIILDVNTKSDFDYIDKIYKDLYPINPNFGIKEIIKWHDNVYKNQGKQVKNG